MKILHIIDTLNVGGAERVLVTLSNIFQSKGHEVDVLTILTHGELANELNPGINVFTLGRKWKFNPIKMYQLCKIARNYDIVHLHMRYDLKYVFLSKILFGLKTKVVSQDHYGDILIDPAIPKFAKYYLKRVTYAAVSQDLIEWAVNKVGLPRNETFLLSNIVQIQKNNQNGQGYKTPEILMVANFRPTKNIEFAIQLMNKIKEDGYNYKLDIVGQINDFDYYEKMVQLVEELGLKENIRFIHDCYSVQSILSNYTIAIHTAKSESGPLVLIEYLGHNLPFISYKTGRVIEQTHDDLPEFIIDSYNLEDWVKAINKIIKLRKDKKTQGLNDRMKKVFDLHFSEKKYYEKCLDIYKFALKN